MTATLPLPTLPLNLLTTNQKFELIDVIEASIAQDEQRPIGGAATPSWHYEVLKQREEALIAGEDHWLDIDDCMTQVLAATS